MTALNAIRYQDAVLILTDGASYDGEGVVMDIRQKCETLDPLGIAFAVSGATSARRILRRLLVRDFRDIDHIADEGDAWFRNWYAVFADYLEEMAQRDLAVVMAGWSKRENRARLLVFTSLNPECPFGEPARLQSPIMDGPILFEHATFHAERDGVALLERQRQHRGSNEFGGPSVVGGHTMLSTIDRTGIRHRVLKTWPQDRVGSKIDLCSVPFAAPNVVLLDPSSRAERRRAQRSGKRRAA